MKRILLIDDVHPLFYNTFKSWSWEVIDGKNWDIQKLHSEIDKFNGIIIRSRFVLDEKILKKAINLQFISRPGSGLENIDTKYCNKNNIKVFRSPEGNMDALGEHIIGMLLCLLNNINIADAQVRDKIWKREENRGIELKGKTIGIIGYGFMGLSFAKKLSGFDVNVIAYDKYKTNFSSDIVTQVSLSELQERSDIVSLHTPLTQETIGLIDYSFLNSFKKSIILINSARGRSVVLKDVLKALDSKKLIGACLDVLELESSSFEVLKGDNTIINELLKRQNIIFTPHIAGWSDEAKIKMAEVLIEKISIFSQNEA